MQALIIAGAGDAKVILAALGQIAYNGANAIGAFLGGEAIRHYGFANFSALPGSILSFISAIVFISLLLRYPRARHKNPAEAGFLLKKIVEIRSDR